MKRLLILFAVFFFALSCDKEGRTEAYPGEKIIEYTVWGKYSDKSNNISQYMVFRTVDTGCMVQLLDKDGNNIHFDGRYVYEPEKGHVSITPGYAYRVDDSQEQGTTYVPNRIDASISASGMHLEWTLCDTEYSLDMEYICKADQVFESGL